MRRALPLILVVWLCSGCFVLDELDKGAAIMDQHASQERREAEAKKKAEEEKEQEGSLLSDLQGQVASLGGWLEEASEEAPPERDPSDTIVRCQMGGRSEYLRKSDCRIRGGRPL